MNLQTIYPSVKYGKTRCLGYALFGLFFCALLLSGCDFFIPPKFDLHKPGVYQVDKSYTKTYGTKLMTVKLVDVEVVDDGRLFFNFTWTPNSGTGSFVKTSDSDSAAVYLTASDPNLYVPPSPSPSPDPADPFPSPAPTSAPEIEKFHLLFATGDARIDVTVTDNTPLVGSLVFAALPDRVNFVYFCDDVSDHHTEVLRVN